MSRFDVTWAFYCLLFDVIKWRRQSSLAKDPRRRKMSKNERLVAWIAWFQWGFPSRGVFLLRLSSKGVPLVNRRCDMLSHGGLKTCLSGLHRFVRASIGVALSGAVVVGVPVWRGSYYWVLHRCGSFRGGVGMPLACLVVLLPLGAFSKCVACAYAVWC